MVAFGMQLPIQSQSTIFVQPWEAAAGAAELVAGGPGVRGARASTTSPCATTSPSPPPGASDEHHVVGHHRHALVPRRRHRAGPAAQPRVRAAVPPPAGWRPRRGRRSTGSPAGGRSSASGPVTSKASSRRSASSFADRGRLLDEGIDARAAPRWPTSSPATTASAGSSTGRPAAAPGAGERCRSGSAARRRPPCGAPLSEATAGCRRARPRAGWPPGSTSSAPTAPTTRGDDPIVARRAVGPLYVGEPAWETAAAASRAAEKVAGYLRTYADLGVDQIQVGFVSRSADELCDQIAAFAADVGATRERSEGNPTRCCSRGRSPSCPASGPGMGRDISLRLARARGRRRTRRPAHREERGGGRGGAGARAPRRGRCRSTSPTRDDVRGSGRAGRSARSAGSTSSSTTPSRTATARRSSTRRSRSGGRRWT